MIGTPAGLQRRPMTAEGEKRPISAAGIRQDFEGHGIAVLPELERGYINGPLRPMSAARALPEGRDGGSSSATGAAASDGSRRRRKKQPAEARMRIHVHLREKTMEVNAGTGAQCIYWLGVTGVQRYVVDPDSYTRPYSEELTPKVRRSRSSLSAQQPCSSRAAARCCCCCCLLCSMLCSLPEATSYSSPGPMQPRVLEATTLSMSGRAGRGWRVDRDDGSNPRRARGRRPRVDRRGRR